ncbi:hypothetical protein [Nocardia sp. NPDC127526]|uniref:hypothetical protein n=1 Tax=Nocardia sp. NPDC127526 TaxID=3345393 RepID=UPI00362A2170
MTTDKTRLLAQVALIPPNSGQYTAVQARPTVDLAEMLTAIIETDALIPLGDTVIGKLADLEVTVTKMRKLEAQYERKTLTPEDVTGAQSKAKVDDWVRREVACDAVAKLAKEAVHGAVLALRSAAEDAQPGWLAALDQHYRERWDELYLREDSINEPMAVVLQRDRDRKQIDRLHEMLRHFAGLTVWAASVAEMLTDRYEFTEDQWAALSDRTGGGMRLRSRTDSYEQIIADIGASPRLFSGGRSDRWTLIAGLDAAVSAAEKLAAQPRNYSRQVVF